MLNILGILNTKSCFEMVSDEICEMEGWYELLGLYVLLVMLGACVVYEILGGT